MGSHIWEFQNPCRDIRVLPSRPVGGPGAAPEARPPTFQSRPSVQRGLRLARSGPNRWIIDRPAGGAATRDPRLARQPSPGLCWSGPSSRASSLAGSSQSLTQQPILGRVPPTPVPHWGNSIWQPRPEESPAHRGPVVLGAVVLELRRLYLWLVGWASVS